MEEEIAVSLAPLSQERILEIFAHWDAKEDLCTACESEWSKLAWSMRKEYHHDYELEKEE